MVSIHGNPPVFLPSPPERKNPAQTEPKAEFIKEAVEKSMTPQQSQKNPHRKSLQETGNTPAHDQKDGSWQLAYGNDGTLQEWITTPQGVEHTHPYPTTDVQKSTTIGGSSVETYSTIRSITTTPQGTLVDNKA